MVEKDYQLSLVGDVKRARISRADDFSPLSPIRYGTKILNLHSIYNLVNKFAIVCGIEWPFFTKSKILEKEGKTEEIGLLICIWKNQFADGEVDCLGFLPGSQSFAFSTSCKSAQSVRYLGFTRTEIRFATCVDKQGKRYSIELDSIRGFEDDFLEN